MWFAYQMRSAFVEFVELSVIVMMLATRVRYVKIGFVSKVVEMTTHVKVTRLA